MGNNIIIRLENKNEYREVENLVRESFWNVYRPGCLEHYVLHQLRNDPAFVPKLDFVMTLDGRLMEKADLHTQVNLASGIMVWKMERMHHFSCVRN